MEITAPAQATLTSLPVDVLRTCIFGRFKTDELLKMQPVSHYFREQINQALLEQAPARHLQPRLVAHLCERASVLRFVYFENLYSFQSDVAALEADLTKLAEGRFGGHFERVSGKVARHIGQEILSPLKGRGWETPLSAAGLDDFCERVAACERPQRIELLRSVVRVVHAIRMTEVACGTGIHDDGLVEHSIFDRKMETVRQEREILSIANQTIASLSNLCTTLETHELPEWLDAPILTALQHCAVKANRTMPSDMQGTTATEICQQLQDQLGHKALNRGEQALGTFRHSKRLAFKSQFAAPAIRGATYVGEFVFAVPTIIGTFAGPRASGRGGPQSRHWFWSAPHRALDNARGYTNQNWSYKYNPEQAEVDDLTKVVGEFKLRFSIT